MEDHREDAMATSRTHMTALPPGFITVRILQLLFTIVVLGLSIFVVVVIGGFSGFITTIIDAITLIVLIWLVSATYLFPKAYNYWAVLAMEITLFVLSIVSFIFALENSFRGYYDDCYYDPNVPMNSDSYVCNSVTTIQAATVNASIAVAALTGSNMPLYLTSMIVVSVFISRHRDAGGHNKIGSAAPVFREKHAALMLQTDLELRQQNIVLREQFLNLQQQHLDLQRATGVAMPPMVAGQMGQQDFARQSKMNPATNTGGNGQFDGRYGFAQMYPYPASEELQSPATLSQQHARAGYYAPAGSSNQSEVMSSVKGKERGDVSPHTEMKVGQGIMSEPEDEISVAQAK